MFCMTNVKTLNLCLIYEVCAEPNNAMKPHFHLLIMKNKHNVMD